MLTYDVHGDVNIFSIVIIPTQDQGAIEVFSGSNYCRWRHHHTWPCNKPKRRNRDVLHTINSLLNAKGRNLPLILAKRGKCTHEFHPLPRTQVCHTGWSQHNETCIWNWNEQCCCSANKLLGVLQDPEYAIGTNTLKLNELSKDLLIDLLWCDLKYA